MALEHVVLFKIKEMTPPEKIEALLQELMALKKKIPTILDLSCGRNFSSRSKGYHLGLVVRFEDEKALNTYQTDPDHVNVLNNLIKPIAEDIIAVDYNF